MQKFRYKVDPILGVQRPSGSPTSDAGASFISSVAVDLGGIVATIPGTNYMYLIRQYGDSKESAEIQGLIQPGDWVMNEEGRCFIRSVERVNKNFEVIL